MIDLTSAIDAFVASFCYIRSFTHPYESVDMQTFRALRDAPRKSRRSRTEELVILPGVEAGKVVEDVRRYQPHGRYLLDVCSAGDDEADDLKRQYKQLGYRLLRTEPLMAVELRKIAFAPQTHEVCRVKTENEAHEVARLARSRVLKHDDFTSVLAPVRVYYVRVGGEIAGWSRSVFQHRDVCYLAGMFTEEAYRRKGVAASMLQRILSDDALTGARYTVLLASHAGELLYLSQGFKDIGALHMFSPR